MKITNELAMRVVNRIIKVLDQEIDINCCETEDQIYETIIRTIRYNRRQALSWKTYKNDISHKVI